MLVQAKSLLAKLLASENITVEHRKSLTAYFDTKNRIMVLPAWKEMTPDLYDLLLGHETGHALFTPPDGWHDKVTDETKKGFKTYLNVIEDVRIEKRIQEKFPGLKSSFRKGYADLMEKDFFGLERMDMEIHELPLIDRINLHYKVGSYLNIQFSDEEQFYIEKIDAMKTWEDVVEVAEMLYGKAKENIRKEFEDMMNDFELSEDDDDDDEEIDSDDWEEGKKSKTFGQMGSNSEDDEDPESITDRHFRSREKELVDDTVKPFYYANCPTPNLRNIIAPYKNMKLFYNNFNHNDSTRYERTGKLRPEYLADIEAAKTKLYTKFASSNSRYISYLVKEFELRRNARQFARASVSKTGELDMKKIHQFKLNDDLFKRMTVVPNGKSHGLVMFLDYSGSMADNINSTIEQTLVLATFCRKVNIPFRVYAFTDGAHDFEQMSTMLGYQPGDYRTYIDSHKYDDNGNLKDNKYLKFSKNEGELDLDSNHNFVLREYLSSEMSGTEFKTATKHWLLVAELMDRSRTWLPQRDPNLIDRGYRNGYIESLNGTPLNEAIIASMEIISQFKAKYKLDVVNTVFLTDGDANETNGVIGGKSLPQARYSEGNVVIRDTKTGLEGRAAPGQEMTIALLNLLKAKVGGNIIGFFLIPTYHQKRVILSRISRTKLYIADFDKHYNDFKKNKFFMLNDVGYDDFYFIPGDRDLAIEEDKMETPEKGSKNDFKKAFMKMQKGKSVNRILLSRFAQKIA
jgi:hypothetical protein